MLRLIELIADWLYSLAIVRKRERSKARHEQYLSFRCRIYSAKRGVLETAEEMIILQEQLERAWQVRLAMLVVVGALLPLALSLMLGDTEWTLMQAKLSAVLLAIAALAL